MTVPRKKAEPQEAASIEENFARLEEIIKGWKQEKSP